MTIESMVTITGAEYESLRAEIIRLRKIIDFIGEYESGAGLELYPCGCHSVEWSQDGMKIVKYNAPWYFAYSTGDTFIEAVEAEMKKLSDA